MSYQIFDSNTVGWNTAPASQIAAYAARMGFAAEEMSEIEADIHSFLDEFPISGGAFVESPSPELLEITPAVPPASFSISRLPPPSQLQHWGEQVLSFNETDSAGAGHAPPVLSSQPQPHTTSTKSQTSSGTKRKHSETKSSSKGATSSTRRAPLQETDATNVQLSKKRQKSSSQALVKDSGSKKTPRKAKKAVNEFDSDYETDGSVSDTPISDESSDEDDDRASNRWSVEQTKQLLANICSPSGRYTQTHKKHPMRAYKRMSMTIFNGLRKPSAIKSRYSRLFTKYKAIVRFESWMGNRSGDPDIKTRLEKAKKSNTLSELRSLTVTAINIFKQNGYFDFFEMAAGNNPSVVRVQEYASGVLSDADSVDLEEPEKQNTSSEQRNTTQPTTSSTQPASQHTPGVPAKRHQGRPRKSSPSPVPLDPAIAEYLATSGSFLIQSAKAHQKSTEIHEARFKLESQKSRLTLLQSVLGNDSIPEDSKALALASLNKMLQAIGDDI
ncbi:hypothetical protein EST38_g11895 [Candolleomyces aberdarensis]|uniref:Uncharacterized protein n=1 Tax=Candolleomyces aberdarensis TaxID=2316362 RepID=A0A4Q2D3S3_9AGAR|nr:hypothetical protein EST38_g11895 [Candolleomyces aberdarensis]